MKTEPLSPRSANAQIRPRVAEGKPQQQDAGFTSRKEHAPPPPSSVWQPPEVPGGPLIEYKTGKELGKGGFAICYEGTQWGRNGAQVYALKIMKAKLSQKKMEDKFRTELQIHAKMSHPNIVEFHKAFTFDECTYVVLELCPNGSIQEMVRTRKGLSLPEIRRFGVQLCGAIKYMHTRNVIHRDLKMGNLFLDHEMNVKIGDFGLAAILVSPGEYEGSYKKAKAVSRRTTLCGTPNYIAPEILDKGKGGHDLKVDIWALGCIITSAEIYEKAKAVDYEWNVGGTMNNDVPEEAKDLVAALLKPNPTNRLGLDEVVSHPFFCMHGADCIPATMDPRSKKHKPDWLSEAKPRGDVMKLGAQRLKLEDLAKSCGVGHFGSRRQPFDVIGDDVDTSLYKACLAEEIAESCPQVPLPEKVLYIGKPSTKKNISVSDIVAPALPTAPRLGHAKSRRILEILDEDAGFDYRKPKPSKNVVPQDHHEQEFDAHAAGIQSQQPSSEAATLPTTSETRDRPAIESASMRVPSGLMHGRPVRISKTLPRNTSRVTRSQKAGSSKETAIPIHDEEPMSQRRLTKDQIIDQLSPNPDEKRRQMALQGKARIAANLQNELNALNDEDRKTSRETIPVRAKRSSKRKAVGWLVSPEDKVEKLPKTTANDVLAGLNLLRDRVDEAFRIAAADPRAPTRASEGKPTERPPFLTKWVDYTNKLGVGYSLENGSMGCLLKAHDGYNNPPCGVIVSRIGHHFLNRHNPDYSDASLIVPSKGPPIEFTEMSGTNGMTRLFVPTDRFKSAHRAETGALRFEPSSSVHETEKRRRISIWTRFTDYMVQRLGDDFVDVAEFQPGERHVPSTALRFYQRLGSVSVWGFADGAFQFNFPDHTKFMLHSDGEWIDYVHLPLDLTEALKEGVKLVHHMLEKRGKLVYRVADLLRLCYADATTTRRTAKQLVEVLRANDTLQKLQFIRQVLGVWVREGGMGKLGEEKFLKWEGYQDPEKGLAWVSVGASGGGDMYYKLPPGEEVEGEKDA
ncbi:MAG: hypothetical protein Q9174_002142 [Haloplaca sp. 1 TL-2023]